MAACNFLTDSEGPPDSLRRRADLAIRLRFHETLEANCQKKILDLGRPCRYRTSAEETQMAHSDLQSARRVAEAPAGSRGLVAATVAYIVLVVAGLAALGTTPAA